MGVYATVSDVQQAIPQIKLSEATRPSLDEVASLIEAVEAELSSVLGTLGYTVPVVGPLSKRILRDMVVQETSSRVLHAQVFGVRDADDLGAARAHALYMERLRALADQNNPFTLPDAVLTDRIEKLMPELGSIFSTGGGADDDDYERRITRVQVF